MNPYNGMLHATCIVVLSFERMYFYLIRHAGLPQRFLIVHKKKNTDKKQNKTKRRKKTPPTKNKEKQKTTERHNINTKQNSRTT